MRAYPELRLGVVGGDAALLVGRLSAPRDVTAAYRLLQDAALRADNVGINEYPSLEEFEHLVGYSDAFVFREESGVEIKVNGNSGDTKVGGVRKEINNNSDEKSRGSRATESSGTKISSYETASENTDSINDFQAIVIIEPRYGGHSRSLKPRTATVTVVAVDEFAHRQTLVRFSLRAAVLLNRG